MKIMTGVAVAASLSLYAGTSSVAVLSVQDNLGTFNLVTENYTGTQEVEGRTYIGSDLSGVTGQFGFNAPSDGEPWAELSVDGDLINSTINLTVGDEADISGTNSGSVVNNGTLNELQTDLPMFDFASFEAEATYLSGLLGVSADLSDMNNKSFGGAEIVNVSLADLNGGGYSFDYTGTSGFIIVNVSGTTGTFNMNPLGGATDDAPSVLWNFYEATSIQVNSVIEGHVLAPLATMSGFTGSSEGTVIAHSVNLTNGELHQQDWTGTVPTDVSEVPLPATGLLLMSSMIGLGISRRKSKTNA